MSDCFQRQSWKNFEFCSHKNCTLTEAFVGGAGLGGSSSSSSVPSLVSSSPVSQGLEWLIVPEEGMHERSMLSAFLVINEAEVEEASSGGGESSPGSGGFESGWFSPERCSLSYKVSGNFRLLLIFAEHSFKFWFIPFQFSLSKSQHTFIFTSISSTL